MASNVTEQPLIGIFATTGCAFIYSLPNAIIGGPIYVYTTADDGSRPEVLTRIKLTNAAFVCNAPLTTLVNYILIGTMEIGVGNFVVQYAGYNSAAQRGCQASYEFSFPGVNSLQGVSPINAQGQLEISPSVSLSVNSISPTASQVAPQLNNGLPAPQLPFGPMVKPVVVLPVQIPKGVKEGPGPKNSGPKNGVPDGKGKSKFLRS